MKPPKKSDWYHIYLCVKCGERLTHHMVFQRGGVCPACGHYSGCTVCEAHTESIRRWRISPWWKLWAVRYQYEGSSERAQQWCKDQNEFNSNTTNP